MRSSVPGRDRTKIDGAPAAREQRQRMRMPQRDDASHSGLFTMSWTAKIAAMTAPKMTSDAQPDAPDAPALDPHGRSW